MAVIHEHNKTLYPVIVQHARTLQVLMFAFADDEALRLTRETGYAHFYIRSRQALWKKGETSGHVQPVIEIRTDCDQDTYLYVVDSPYPACHLNRDSCFGDAPKAPADPLTRLMAIIRDRLAAGDLEHSYSAKMVTGPLERLLKKIGEEAIEVIIAAAQSQSAPDTGRAHATKDDLTWETVDLLYHLAALLTRFDLPLEALQAEVEHRHRPTESDA